MNLQEFKNEVLPLREKLLRFARSMVPDEAEDAVQEALLRLWTCRERLAECDNIGGFAMQTVKHICIDKLRVVTNCLEVDEQTGLPGEQTPYERLEVQDSVAIVKQIIESLPGLQQQIIRMRDVEGYELSEIAAITGTKVEAVTVNLSRARKRVRERFIEIQAYKQRVSC